MITKNKDEAKEFVEQMHLDMDPRDIFYVKLGQNRVERKMIVPKASWVRNPETLAIGEYAYDTLSSASFKVGNFDFFEFLDAVSDGSSYEMVKSIRKFYDNIAPDGEDVPAVSAEDVRARYREEIVCRAYCSQDPKLTNDQIGAAFGVTGRMVTNWVKEYRKTHPELPNKK